MTFLGMHVNDVMLYTSHPLVAHIVYFLVPHCVSLRVTDLVKIKTLNISWLFQDQLEKLEDHALYRTRTQGGLNLTNVEVKALSLLIKTFLETATSEKFQRNIYH